MVKKLFAFLIHLIVILISKLGYGGILITMAAESASIPLPSEVVMPFAGFLVTQGQLQFWLVVLIGSLGCLFGSWSNWWLGKHYGESVVRHLIRRYGKFVFVFEYELDDSIKLFKRHGEGIIFFSRLLPVIRTFISLPAGIAQMSFRKFSIYTFSGSFFWTTILTWLGMYLGSNWIRIDKWFHRFDILIVVGIIVLFIWYPWYKIRRHHHYQNNHQSQP